MEHLQHDWERQRELLSALLDNELDEQERAALTAHLPTCAECRAELESLRRTRALVRALPQPALPRSFALPLEAAPVQELPLPATAAARPAQAPARRPPSAPPARLSSRRRPLRTLQWISAIAAVLGIALLLSSAFPSLSLESNATSGSANSAPVAASTGQPSSTPVPTSRTTDTQTGGGTPSVPTAKPTPSTPSPTTNTGQTPGPTTGTPSSTPLGPLISTTGLGVLLLILSVCGFTIAWAVRRRW